MQSNKNLKMQFVVNYIALCSQVFLLFCLPHLQYINEARLNNRLNILWHMKFNSRPQKY